ncbi:CbtA family protein [Natrinema caseinilyticum]|uniref:CbtA family protein n=1 Tax=Natrinema caseinilyticum TaxID=2961570 RepID=UPI0020C4AB23|nr:CbtA family protein [Natrinema caseinilyticum]
MLAEYLTRGVKAGLVAGLVFGLFMAIVANPLVAYADELNHAAAADGPDTHHSHGQDAEHGHGHDAHDGGEKGDHHDTAVSMGVNKTVSVISGGLWAVLLGGAVFGLGFYVLEPAIPGTGATKSYVLGLAGFITVSGAPWLVLPPASPGAQQSLPVGIRLLLYGGMMVAGGLTCLLAGSVYTRLRESNGGAVAAVGAVVPFVLLAIPTVLAPTNTVRGALSPGLRAGLTGLFVFGQLLVWLVLATTHAQFRSADDSSAEFGTSSPDPAVTTD